jgi:hypothetical protein
MNLKTLLFKVLWMILLALVKRRASWTRAWGSPPAVEETSGVQFLYRDRERFCCMSATTQSRTMDSRAAVAKEVGVGNPAEENDRRPDKIR